MGEKGEVRAEMRRRRKQVSADERASVSAKICARLARQVEGWRLQVEQGNGKFHSSTSTPNFNSSPAADYQLPTTNFTIAVYLASPDEIDLAPFIDDCMEKGIRLAAPRWNGASYELAELNGHWPDGLVEGPHAIREPPQNAPRIGASEVATWIVPGLAFTKEGLRLGYGGGWYDRLLSSVQPSTFNLQPVRIGVGYRFQIADALPSEPHDVRLDDVVTA